MVDYSKWKNIEISDDEDETHPNIDTPSLFRWRHQARVEQMDEREKEKQALMKQKSEHEKKINELKEKMDKVEVSGEDDVKKSLDKLQKENEKLKNKEEEIAKQEKLQPWNVDTISKDGFSKTMINATAKSDEEELSEDQRVDQFRDFVQTNESLIKEFGFLQHYGDSVRFLNKHSHLVCEHTTSYLLLHCINLEIEEKHGLMKHVAHQTICVNFILELARQLNRDPRACVSPFFCRIQKAEPEYRKAFTDELDSLVSRVKQRAAVKLEEAINEAKEEEKKKRLGPGGLDPFDVLETLPEELRACFESQDLSMLQVALGNMEIEEAKNHMKRCVASGLWVPQGSEDPNADLKLEEDGDKKKEEI